MLLAHKIEIRPTKEQKQFFEQACGSSRHLYNNLVDHFSQEGVKWSKKEARQFYYASRDNFPWYSELSSEIFQSTINNLEVGFKKFFKTKVGFPKFHKKGVKDSFSITQAPKFRVEGRNLYIEKFNKGRKGKPITLRENLRFTGKPKQLTISNKAGRWFASILVEVESGYNLKQAEDETSIGIDLGIKTLVTTSDGESIGKSDKLSKQLKKLAKLQQKMAKQKKGSNRRAKTKLKIQKLFYYVSCQKQALLHSVSGYLTSRYKTICMEDLDVKGMLEKGNKSLSRMIADVGMYEFRRQVEYKSFLRGGDVKFVDRYFPSSKMCSCCGNIKEDLKLSDRTYRCDCRLEIDRDLNAAINILNQGSIK
ncbi:coil containing protein [Vibrio phage 1.187.O._10N.286.49.F1]|nr:coil containing protein [Vibrio phage 1.187.O._10N.286.49.F1]